MFKIVIADDEPIIIKGLIKMIDWAGYNTQVVGTAKNGEELMEVIPTLKPDIIITDISMPRATGVDIIKYVEEEKLNIKIIFLTAYQEFEYAQAAVKYGVTDYLLKPASKQELEHALVKAQHALENNSSLEYLKENTSYFEYLNGDEKEYEEIEKKFEELGISCRELNLFVMCINVSKNKEKFLGDRNGYELYRFSVFRKIQECIKKYKMGFVLKREGNYCHLLLAIDEGQKSNVYAEKIRVSLEEEKGCELVIGIGKIVTTLSDIKAAYKTAVFTCGVHYFTQETLIIYDELSKEYTKSFDDYNREYGELVKCVLGNREEWKEKLKNCLLIIRELHFGNKTAAENRCVSLCMEFYREMVNYHRLESEKDEGFEKFVSSLRNQESFNRMEKNVLAYMEKFIQEKIFTEYTQDKEIIQNIKAYLDENYSKDINLKVMSKQFYMNAYYFSVFFKKETGMNFKDYLAELRMKKAAEFLMEKDWKTQELARQVGYRDAKSFADKFKQYFGESPSNYKKSIGEIR